MSILAVASVTLGVQANSHPGYLPVVGPAPLRFQTPVPLTAMITLPPLLMEDPKPAVPTNAMDVAYGPPPAPIAPVATNVAPAAPTTNVVVVVTDTMPTNASTNAGPGFVMPDTGEAGTISPQMLIHFFRQRGSTNGGPAVVVPQTFTPPAPAAQRSSTATFNSP